MSIGRAGFSRRDVRVSLGLGFLALAVVIGSRWLSWYEWMMWELDWGFSTGRQFHERTGLATPSSWFKAETYPSYSMVVGPVQDQAAINAAFLIYPALCLLCLGLWLRSLGQSLRRRHKPLITALVLGLVALLPAAYIVLSLALWFFFYYGVQVYPTMTLDAEIVRVYPEGPLALALGALLAIVAYWVGVEARKSGRV